jgi:hypothetical protein
MKSCAACREVNSPACHAAASSSGVLEIAANHLGRLHEYNTERTSVKTFLIWAFIVADVGGVLYAQTSANTEWRIPGYSSYVELKDGTVYCGDEYASYHEGRTGKLCAGGQYTSLSRERDRRSRLRVLNTFGDHALGPYCRPQPD